MSKDLLARIEKLEQAIQDIWASCACLNKDLEPDIDDLPGEFNCEPFRDELPEEPEDLCGGDYESEEPAAIIEDQEVDHE